MSVRPSIPRDIRRQVLLEAGHRCAILTCRHTDIDIHHIKPLREDGQHAAEDLIAPCPNCHRLAEAGKIDRTALRAYKERLRAQFSIGKIKGSEDYASILDARLEDSAFVENATTGHSASVHAQYPKLFTTSGGLSEVGEIVRSLVLREVHSFRTANLITGPSLFGELWSPQSSYLASGYDVTLHSADAISIRFSFVSYSWGAHSSHWTRVLNYLLQPAQELCIETIFKDKASAESKVSKLCIGRLLARGAQKEVSRSEAWVVRGAGPKLENFKKFNLTPDGI